MNETARFGEYGSKFESGMDKAQIAKLIRADIKHAQTLPESDPMRLPKGAVVSVRLQRYSGGSSIHVVATCA